MSAFKDAGGRTWEVAVNVAGIKRVRSLLKIDLLAMVRDEFKALGELLGDPCQLVDVLYVLCKPQADEGGVGDEDFGRLMAGDVLGEATAAFLEGYADFFPDAKLRTSLRQMFKKAKRVSDLAAAQLETAAEALSPEAILEAALARVRSTSKNSSGNSPGSAGLTPARGP